MKKIIRLTESDLHRIVKRAASKIIRESFDFEFSENDLDDYEPVLPFTDDSYGCRLSDENGGMNCSGTYKGSSILDFDDDPAILKPPYDELYDDLDFEKNPKPTVKIKR